MRVLSSSSTSFFKTTNFRLLSASLLVASLLALTVLAQSGVRPAANSSGGTTVNVVARREDEANVLRFAHHLERTRHVSLPSGGRVLLDPDAEIADHRKGERRGRRRELREHAVPSGG